MPEPWLIHFFQRHKDDDPVRPVPTIDFLDGLPDKVAAEIQAVLEAVATVSCNRFRLCRSKRPN